MSVLTTEGPDDDRTFLSLIEMDLAAGAKRPVADLDRYLVLKKEAFANKPHWRHKESGTVYRFVGLGFAATGLGKLALMVGYCPLDGDGEHHPRVSFLRQYAAFMDRFEEVTPRTVWDKA